MLAPRMPPTTGKTMNTQSWSSAQLPWNTAVARLRAGFTDVLSIGIEMRWMTRERQPDGDAREARPASTCGWSRRSRTRRRAVKKTSASITGPRWNPPGSGCRTRWTRSRYALALYEAR